MASKLRLGLMISSPDMPMGAYPDENTRPIVDKLILMCHRHAEIELTCGEDELAGIDALLIMYVDEGNPIYVAKALADTRIPVLLWSVRGDDQQAQIFRFAQRGAMAAAAQLDLSGCIFTYVENCSADDLIFQSAIRYFVESAVLMKVTGYSNLHGRGYRFETKYVRFDKITETMESLCGMCAKGRFVMRHPSDEFMLLFNFSDYYGPLPKAGETVTLISSAIRDGELRLLCFEVPVVEGPKSLGPHLWMHVRMWPKIATRVEAEIYPMSMFVCRGKHSLAIDNFCTYTGCIYDGLK
ncbi:MAG: hypothetical protein IKV30_04330 [Clostridia bacterium]|nr:hypothetical protein [Clostridia bacterium]